MKTNSEGWSFNEFWRRLDDILQNTGFDPAVYSDAAKAFRENQTVDQAVAWIADEQSKLND